MADMENTNTHIQTSTTYRRCTPVRRRMPSAIVAVAVIVALLGTITPAHVAAASENGSVGIASAVESGTALGEPAGSDSGHPLAGQFSDLQHEFESPGFLDPSVASRFSLRAGVQAFGGVDLNPAGAYHRSASLSVDRVAVWVCRVPAGSIGYGPDVQERIAITPEQAASWANRVVRPEFTTMSKGRYAVEFTPAGYIDLTPSDDPGNCLMKAADRTDSPFTLSLAFDNTPLSGGLAGPGYLTEQVGLPPSVTMRGGWVGGNALTGPYGKFVTVHEIGHTLHWPHNYNGTDPYGNKLDVMSGGIPFANTIAFNRYVAGWLDDSNVRVYNAGTTQVIDIDRPLAGGVEMVVIPTGDPLNFITLDARPAVGADATLPVPGVAVHQIDQRPCPNTYPGVPFCPSLQRTFRQVPSGPTGTEHVIRNGRSAVVGKARVSVLRTTPTGYRVQITNGNPTGSLDPVQLVAPGEVRVKGWATDPDVAGAIAVHLYVNDRFHSAIGTGVPRLDVQLALPIAGPNAGFDSLIRLPAGNQRVCAYAVNVGAGGNTGLGCRNVTVGGNPFGNLDRAAVSGPRRVTLIGWSLDPDTTAPTQIHIYAGSQFVGWASAAVTRNDVAKSYPGFGPGRGFTATVELPAGRHNVCAYAINVGAGTGNPGLGCRVVVVGGNPVGFLDGVRLAGPGTVAVNGWALDPDTDAPTRIHVYAGSRHVATIATNQTRNDVGKAYPGFGTNRGFSGTVQLAAGAHAICAYALNVGSGTTNPSLGCRTITVGGKPVGSLDAAAQGGPGEVIVSGWALDPDTANPTGVRLNVDGRVVATVTTDARRGDVAALFPGFGDLHGYRAVLALPNGTHRVCAVGVNVGAGSGDTILGCRDVTVGGAPRGAFETIAPAGFAKARVTGWALDPDTAGSASVRITVGTQVASTAVADVPNPAIGLANPGFGDRRGFSTEVDLGPGVNQVCSVVVNVGLGTDLDLGCKPITVTGSPRGTFDGTTLVNGQVRVRGWAFDPDTDASVPIVFTVNGVNVGGAAANTSRPDVARVYPGFGPNRGFDTALTRRLSGQVCATVRNVGPGADTSLGCRTMP